jgi:hypothetical protein
VRRRRQAGDGPVLDQHDLDDGPGGGLVGGPLDGQHGDPGGSVDGQLGGPRGPRGAEEVST